MYSKGRQQFQETIAEFQTLEKSDGHPQVGDLTSWAYDYLDYIQVVTLTLRFPSLRLSMYYDHFGICNVSTLAAIHDSDEKRWRNPGIRLVRNT